jgi:hypothetical protein
MRQNGIGGSAPKVQSGRLDRAETPKKGTVRVTVKNNNWPAISPALTQESPQIQCDQAK